MSTYIAGVLRSRYWFYRVESLLRRVERSSTINTACIFLSIRSSRGARSRDATKASRKSEGTED